MIVENNIGFVYAPDLTDKIKKEIDLESVYVGESDYILTATEESYNKLIEYLKERFGEDISEDISKIPDVEHYINQSYIYEEYNILGFTGYLKEYAEETTEKISYAIDEGKFDYENWENEIDTQLKTSVMESISYKLGSVLEKLNNEGFNIKSLEFAFEKYFGDEPCDWIAYQTENNYGAVSTDGHIFTDVAQRNYEQWKKSNVGKKCLKKLNKTMENVL